MGLKKTQRSEKYDGISQERNTRFGKKIKVSICMLLLYKYQFKPYSYVKGVPIPMCAVN